MAEVSPGLVNALQVYPQNPPAAIDQLLPEAQAGDLVARGLVGWMLAQQGRLGEGVEHALAAARAGAGQLATLYAQQLASQADPSLRQSAAEFFRLAQQFPSVIDFFAQAQSAVQQGNSDLARELLGAAFTTPMASLGEQAQRMVDEADQRLRLIGETEAKVGAEAQRVRDAAERTLAAISREHEQLTEVARQTGALAAGTSAAVQAARYSERADAVERQARLYTYLSLGMAFLIAAAAIGLGATANGDAGVGEIARRAALSLPLVFVNVYLARLATSFRNEALRWRHVELQLQSVMPFLGEVSPDVRGNVIAALAAGFFPGQSLPGDDHANGTDMTDVVTAALQIARPSPVPPASPPPSATS